MDALLDGKITQEHTDEADRFILQIIKHKGISLGEESCKILKDAKEAWINYLAEKNIEKAHRHFDTFGDLLKKLFSCNENYENVRKNQIKGEEICQKPKI